MLFLALLAKKDLVIKKPCLCYLYHNAVEFLSMIDRHFYIFFNSSSVKVIIKRYCLYNVRRDLVGKPHTSTMETENLSLLI